MADPQHVPVLDGLDRLTVALYRVGFLVAATALIGTGLAGPTWGAAGRVLLSTGAALCAWNVHLYDKRFRWLFAGFAWAGLVIGFAATTMDGSAAWLLRELGLGLHLVLLSALALKEQRCFRVPLMRAVPWVMFATSMAHAFAPVAVASGLMILGGGLIAALGLVKLRQPLGFDIGDRSKYQI